MGSEMCIRDSAQPSPSPWLHYEGTAPGHAARSRPHPPGVCIRRVAQPRSCAQCCRRSGQHGRRHDDVAVVAGVVAAVEAQPHRRSTQGTDRKPAALAQLARDHDVEARRLQRPALLAVEGLTYSVRPGVQHPCSEAARSDSTAHSRAAGASPCRWRRLEGAPPPPDGRREPAAASPAVPDPDPARGVGSIGDPAPPRPGWVGGRGVPGDALDRRRGSRDPGRGRPACRSPERGRAPSLSS